MVINGSISFKILSAFRIYPFFEAQTIIECAMAVKSGLGGFCSGALKIHLVILRLFEANKALNVSYSPISFKYHTFEAT